MRAPWLVERVRYEMILTWDNGTEFCPDTYIRTAPQQLRKGQYRESPKQARVMAERIAKEIGQQLSNGEIKLTNGDYREIKEILHSRGVNMRFLITVAIEMCRNNAMNDVVMETIHNNLQQGSLR